MLSANVGAEDDALSLNGKTPYTLLTFKDFQPLSKRLGA
jgi:hypothetical protein